MEKKITCGSLPLLSIKPLISLQLRDMAAKGSIQSTLMKLVEQRQRKRVKSSQKKTRRRNKRKV